MPAFVDHVVVVDDASRDAHGARGARAPGDARVEVIRHEANRGVGAAIVTGYRRARALGADVAAVMAGDGQMHPDDLARVALPRRPRRGRLREGQPPRVSRRSPRHAARAPRRHRRARTFRRADWICNAALYGAKAKEVDPSRQTALSLSVYI